MLKSISTSLLICLITTFGASAEKINFGAGADMSRLQAISVLLDKPDEFIDQQVTVKGTITAVCQKRGCWMELASDKRFQTLKIKVRDGDMVFPMSTKGRTAFATGKLTGKTLDKSQTIKYLKYQAEESNQRFDASSVTKGMTVYQLTPTGVTIAK